MTLSPHDAGGDLRACPFYVGTRNGLRQDMLNTSVVGSLNVLTGCVFSVATTFLFHGEVFYEAAAMLVTFVLFGHWMEMRSRRSTHQSLQRLLQLAPPTAILIWDEQEVELSADQFAVGDILLVKPGAKVAVDDVVIEGESSLGESMITGENLSVKMKAGDMVIGATLNKTGADTALAQIVKRVQAAQNSKAPAQHLADRAAHYLILVAVFAGLGTFLLWYFVLAP